MRIMVSSLWLRCPAGFRYQILYGGIRTEKGELGRMKTELAAVVLAALIFATTGAPRGDLRAGAAQIEARASEKPYKMNGGIQDQGTSATSRVISKSDWTSTRS